MNLTPIAPLLIKVLLSVLVVPIFQGLKKLDAIEGLPTLVKQALVLTVAVVLQVAAQYAGVQWHVESLAALTQDDVSTLIAAILPLVLFHGKQATAAKVAAENAELIGYLKKTGTP